MTPPTKQPAINIDAVPTGPQLDVLVAVEVMEWKALEPFGGNAVWKTRSGKTSWPLGFSTDANRIREVEAEIERRGLVDSWPNGYVEQLVRECVPHIDEDWDEHSAPRTYDDITRAEMFLIIRATPAQKCRAALRTVRQDG